MNLSYLINVLFIDNVLPEMLLKTEMCVLYLFFIPGELGSYNGSINSFAI